MTTYSSLFWTFRCRSYPLHLPHRLLPHHTPELLFLTRFQTRWSPSVPAQVSHCINPQPPRMKTQIRYSSTHVLASLSNKNCPCDSSPAMPAACMMIHTPCSTVRAARKISSNTSTLAQSGITILVSKVCIDQSQTDHVHKDGVCVPGCRCPVVQACARSSTIPWRCLRP